MDGDGKRDAIRTQVAAKFGFVPNLIEEMLASPTATQVYLQGQAAMAEATLTPGQQQAVQLAISTANGCGYCSGAHATLAKAEGVSEADIQAVRDCGRPADPEIAGLVGATWLVMEKRGLLDSGDMMALEADGTSREALFEIIALVGLKTITSYINHIAGTQLDKQLGGA